MKDKLKFLTRQSLNKKIKTKWFKGVNLVLLILLLVITNIDRIVSLFGGDFENQIVIFVKDEINGFDNFQKNFESMSSMLGESKDFKLEKTMESIDALKEKLDEDNEKIVIHLLPDSTNYMKASVISYDDIGTVTKQLLTSSIGSLKESIAFQQSGLSESEILALTSPVEITSVTTNPEVENAQNKDVIASAVILVIILPCFFLILTLVQMIGAEVNDEKTTRSMEIIISNVSPKIHLLSKVISSNLFVIIQGLLLVLFAFVGVGLRIMLGTGDISNMASIGNLDIGETLSSFLTSEIASQLVYIIPLTLLMMVLTFIAYSLLAGVLASMTTNIEDFQQLQTPIMIISLLGYYLAMMAGVFEGSLFIKVFAYVPFISAILAPCLLVLGQFSLLEFVIAIILVVFVIFLLVKYGFRIYKQGILNYSSKGLWKKMFKALKSK